MNKIICFFLLIASFPLFAQVTDYQTPVLASSIEPESEKFEPRKSHWLTSFGFEGMKYPTIYEFSGVKSNFAPRDQELWGTRFGYGRELYLGAGVNTTTKVEAYYLGTLFSKTLNGGTEDEEVKFAWTKRTGQIYGVDASQSIGFLFDMKTKNPIMDEWSYLTVEPFIEAGIGVARAYNRLSYSYVLASTNEQYTQRVEDELINTRIGVGVNFTSTSGYFLYLKATQNRYDVTNRKIEGYVRQNDGSEENINESPKNVNIDPITVYALGGGYKF